MPCREIIADCSEIHTRQLNRVCGQNVEFFFFANWRSETMAFLGQDPVRCKIFMDNKCLQVKNFNYLSGEFRTKMKNIFNKSNNICSNDGNLNNTYKPNLV
jgi:hypothetical protein